MVEVISETQKVGCTSFTSYKVGQKSNIKQKKCDIKQLLNRNLMVLVNTILVNKQCGAQIIHGSGPFTREGGQRSKPRKGYSPSSVG